MKRNPQHKSDDQFPIVGIGASAGGLEALEQFFSNMNENSGMAFIVVQHLDPTYKGMLPELIQRITPMKVIQVKDGLKTRPNYIYVIPPNKSMSLLNGSLHLFEPVESRGLRLPIDFLFCSLAEDRHEKSIGIILSGMGSDGSIGLRSIKDKGGITLIQDPDSAKFSAMPRNAKEAVQVDITAPAGELPEKLLSFLKEIPSKKPMLYADVKDQSALAKIIVLLRIQTGHDFSLYKKTTVCRRIERRMVVNKISKISFYIRFLQENPHELDILFQELLIGVTSFFRDPAVWIFLQEKVLPSLFEKLQDKYVLRVWIPACSTGEEAYSFVIIFKEVIGILNQNNKKISLQVYATDINADAITKARKGYYPASISNDVSPERLSRFFIHSGDGFIVKPEIREMIVFAQQDIIKDPPFTKLDMLLCRNLLIYLDLKLQRKLISLFHYSLKPDSILILGISESIGNSGALFTAYNAKLRFFKSLFSSTALVQTEFLNSFSYNKYDANTKEENMKVPDLQTLTEQLMLQHFTPAGVLVNNKGDILYVSGRTGKYLEPASGKANMNIFAMARPELRNELSISFRKALQNYNKVEYPNIKIKDDTKTHILNLIIQRIEKPEPLKDMVLVIFSDVTSLATKKLLKSKLKEPSDNAHIEELKNELQQLKEGMQSTFEEMQTSQEELKSSNEELQSTNEELQSTNEELTTSKEEMQSLNEELQTVNMELQNKVDEYTSVNNDMLNLLNSTDIATLFLDKNLHIRRYTEQTTRIIKLIQSDIGRSFTDLASEMKYPEMAADAMEVLKTLAVIEKDINTYDGRWLSIRIMPYRTVDDRIDGLVITFNEITKAKNLEAELNKTIAILRSHKLDSHEKEQNR